MFEIDEFTKARLDDIEVLSQKNRQPDEAPGVKLHLEVTLSNHVLSTLDGNLKNMLFTRNENAPKPVVTKKKDNQTGTLDAVEPVSDLPNLSRIGAHVKTVKWSEIVSGCAAAIRFATTELPLDDCSCGPFDIKSKEGGTSVIKFPLEAPNASEKVFAKLAKYKSREIEVRIKQHVPAGEAQQRIDGDAPEPKKDAAPKGDPKGEKKGDAKGENWPFPGDRSAQEQIEASQKTMAADNSPPPQSTTVEAPPKGEGRRTRRVVAGAVE